MLPVSSFSRVRFQSAGRNSTCTPICENMRSIQFMEVLPIAWDCTSIKIFSGSPVRASRPLGYPASASNCLATSIGWRTASPSTQSWV